MRPGCFFVILNPGSFNPRQWSYLMRILLAENRSRVRFALRSLLEEQPGIVVIGEVSDGQDLIAQAEADCPDLVLIDWDLPGIEEDDLLPALREICPDLTVIILSSRPEVKGAALAAGAQAFVSKADPPDQLLAAIQSVKDRWKGDHS
jgi:DNA-binding NarL/FixJ family response regulator